ncbi:MAG TPA: hypothetical protein VKU38_09355 [Ktedonobacteraceae bacterium]|nr:hypothetical protein [Ktedonobacteraceae bacterium]
MRFAIEPTNNANDIHGSGGCKMLEMGFILADIARATQTHDANSPPKWFLLPLLGVRTAF